MKLVTGHAVERGGIPRWAVATAVTGTRYGIQKPTGASCSLEIRASKQMQMWGISFVLADYPSSQKQVCRLVQILVVLREDHKLARCVPLDSCGDCPWSDAHNGRGRYRAPVTLRQISVIQTARTAWVVYDGLLRGRETEGLKSKSYRQMEALFCANRRGTRGMMPN